MMARCYDPRCHGFERYGSRGITVDVRWHDFNSFYADVGDRPSDEYSLDRYPDNNGPYAPFNWRWANAFEQARNKRNNSFLVYNGERHCIAEWAVITGLPDTTLHTRIAKGWPVDDVLTRPTIKTRCVMGHERASQNLSAFGECKQCKIINQRKRRAAAR
jgi:hypothetical protein